MPAWVGNLILVTVVSMVLVMVKNPEVLLVVLVISWTGFVIGDLCWSKVERVLVVTVVLMVVLSIVSNGCIGILKDVCS